VACPYFRPLARLEPRRWIGPPRLPLVDPFDGVCEAMPQAWTPDETTLREYCSFGYARGRCARFPAEAPADAVRFTMGDGQEVLYVLERDYAPVAYGAVGGAAPRLAAQAAAFAAAWARRPRKEPQPDAGPTRS
jgi:hypothetical protein